MKRKVRTRRVFVAVDLTEMRRERLKHMLALWNERPTCGESTLKGRDGVIGDFWIILGLLGEAGRGNEVRGYLTA